jgi:hypothetical protein
MSNRKIVLIVIAVGMGIGTVLIGSCAGLLYLGYKQASDTASPRVDALFAAIEDGTFAKTYETETTRELRQAASKEQYEAMGQAITSRLGKLKSKSLRGFRTGQFNANSFIDATYQATFEQGDGTISVRLKQEGDDWKFVRFHVQSPLFDQHPDLSAANGSSEPAEP